MNPPLVVLCLSNLKSIKSWNLIFKSISYAVFRSSRSFARRHSAAVHAKSCYKMFQCLCHEQFWQYNFKRLRKAEENMIYLGSFVWFCFLYPCSIKYYWNLVLKTWRFYSFLNSSRGKKPNIEKERSQFQFFLYYSLYFFTFITKTRRTKVNRC